MTVQIITGDCREVLRGMDAGSVNCIVTSPPYFGLRDYGHDGQIGLEPTPDEFVAQLVAVFREARRVLRDDGTLWLNLGDSYAANRGYQVPDSKHRDVGNSQPMKATALGLKPKDLIGIPWRVAFALQADGWWLRQDIIWAKPNPMPESVTDRCTKSHEYLFMLTKSERYYFDSKAIAEPAIGQNQHDLTGMGYAAPGQQPHGGNRGPASHKGSTFHNGKTAEHQLGRASTKPRVTPDRKELRSDVESRHRSSVPGGQSMQAVPTETRNRRSVWTVATQPFKGSHFATFPPDLIEPCIKAGCPAGGTVLDPFGGAGTTGMVADRLVRNAILIELNPAYAAMAKARIENDAPLFAETT